MMNMNMADYERLPFGYFSLNDANSYRSLYESLPENAVTCEVGCNLGKSVCAVADIILAKNITLHVVDTFGTSVDNGSGFNPETLNGFYVNITRYELMKAVHIHQGWSVDEAPKFDDQSLDLVFIDANHSYAAVTADINSYLPKVKVGGILSGHDYQHPQPQYFDQIKRAIIDMGMVHYLLPDSIWAHKKLA